MAPRPKLMLTYSQIGALETALNEYIEDFNPQFNPDSRDGMDTTDRRLLSDLRRVLTKLGKLA